MSTPLIIICAAIAIVVLCVIAILIIRRWIKQRKLKEYNAEYKALCDAARILLSETNNESLKE